MELEKISDYLKQNKNQLSQIYIASKIQSEIALLIKGQIKVIVRLKSIVIECENAYQLTSAKGLIKEIEEILRKNQVYKIIKFRISSANFQ